ncbi:Integrin alpha-D, partial [Galemys pyrenaicus]
GKRLIRTFRPPTTDDGDLCACLDGHVQVDAPGLMHQVYKASVSETLVWWCGAVEWSVAFLKWFIVPKISASSNHDSRDPSVNRCAWAWGALRVPGPSGRPQEDAAGSALRAAETRLASLPCSPPALAGCDAFNLDTENAVIFQEQARGFGQSVVQFDGSRVVVGAPQEIRAANQTGGLYECDYSVGTCKPLGLQVPPEAVNMSLGLSLAAATVPPQLLACGPTVHQVCKENTYLNGFCFLFGSNLLQNPRRFPQTLRKCPQQESDIAFLIDGSGSITPPDFQRMKNFVSTVMDQFQNSRTLYSEDFRKHFTFKDFQKNPDPTSLVAPIEQLFGRTHTATGIRKVVRELFHSSSGARENALKILVVITDGEKFGDPLEYEDVIPEADGKNIIRYVIGVGSAFNSASSRRELNTIASKPSREHVFRVNNFQALTTIQNQLQEKIFAIEASFRLHPEMNLAYKVLLLTGTQTGSSSSFENEMSQEGFSAAITSSGPLLGAVGSFDWSGGAFLHTANGASIFINTTRVDSDMNDAYLGYAVDVILRNRVPSLVLGAPRYQHTGLVVMFRENARVWETKSSIEGSQIGSYFGASLCSVDMNRDGNTDLVLIGAPHYYEQTRGGQVSVCPLPQGRAKWQCVAILRGVQGHPWARFGAALTVLGDVNGDKLTDVAIGAPGEQENRGAVYLFHGTSEQGISPSHSQRITGSQFSPKLQYFGQSLSGGRDLTMDGLMDLAVGAQGHALLLRSRPVLRMEADMVFTPKEVARNAFECRDEVVRNQVAGEVRVCLHIHKSTVDRLGAGAIKSDVIYALALDPGHTHPRAVFEETKSNLRKGRQTLGLSPYCETLKLQLPECVDESVTPIILRLNFSLEGQPLSSFGRLRPVLDVKAERLFTALFPFEKNCGNDSICQDDLSVTFSFLNVDTVVVGDSRDLNVTVTVRNQGEDSYRTQVTFFFPPGLSYRRVSDAQNLRSKRSWRPNCVPGASSGDPKALRSSSCSINHPIFPDNSEAIFNITFDVNPDAALGKRLVLKANITSENNMPRTDKSEFQLELPVKYAIYLVVASQDVSNKYFNFTASEKTSQVIQHQYQFSNLGQRSLPVTVVFWVPVKLNEVAVWDAPQVISEHISSKCSTEQVAPSRSDFLEELQRTSVLNCSVAVCQKIQCDIPSFGTQEGFSVTLRGNLSFDWYTQTSHDHVQLVSAAEILFNRSSFALPVGQEAFVRAQTETRVEPVKVHDPVPLIVGSSVGGLLLLALITTVLYKVGFFKRQYKDMMSDAPPQGAPEAAPPDRSSPSSPVLASSLCFNLDTDRPTVFSVNSAGFGHSVVQFGNSRVVVGAPQEIRAASQTGSLYECDYSTGSCRPVPLQVPPEAVNMSLGLSLAADTAPPQLLACGPTVHRACGENMHLTGFCFQFNHFSWQARRVPSALQECPKQDQDIVLLIDGSGSIDPEDFKKMLNFVKAVIRQFPRPRTQFSLMQFSNQFWEHFTFRVFKYSSDPLHLLDSVSQLGGTTHTASAILRVMNRLFSTSAGSRQDAAKILIVITDGEKYNDPLEYHQVIPRAEAAGIIRYAIGGHPWARFGAALTVLGDVNGDKLTDVAIGAPGEQENRGAVYLFHGTSEQSISSSHSQRIEGSQLLAGLQYFGQSLSGGQDLTMDGLVDLAVGAQGYALLLRTRPVLRVQVTMHISPPEVPRAVFECQEQVAPVKDLGEASICLQIYESPKPRLADLQSSVTFDMTLDPGRLSPRAVFKETKTRNLTFARDLGLRRHCEAVKLLLPACVEDAVSPIVLRLNFSLEGKPILSYRNLQPMLAADAQRYFIASLPFEKNCGADHVCQDDLGISFDFPGLNTLLVRSNLELNMSVEVWNVGEDSYGTMATFSYPAGLSYRRVTVNQAKLQSRSLRLTCDSSADGSQGGWLTRCRLNHIIFRKGAQITFTVTFDVSPKATLGDRLLLTANVSSENNSPQTSNSTFQKELPVKYAVYTVVSRYTRRAQRSSSELGWTGEQSTKYLNFSASEEGKSSMILHRYQASLRGGSGSRLGAGGFGASVQVNNLGQRDLPVSIYFWVPVELNRQAVWTEAQLLQAQNSSTRCSSERTAPSAADFLTRLQKKPVLDCSVADCLRFRCDIPSFGVQEELHFVLKGNLSFDWVRQTLQKKVQVVSVAEIHFDTSTYSQFPEQEAFPRAQVEMVLEEYEIYDPVPLIAGSSVGGLLLLAIITAVLYKVGFFKRQYKDMMQEANGQTGSPRRRDFPDHSTHPILPCSAVLASCHGFSLDVEKPVVFQQGGAGFGQSVVQFDGSRLIVGAPLEVVTVNQTGRLYDCEVATGHCQPVRLYLLPEAVNTSLGLSLAASTEGSQLLACGPTLHRACAENMHAEGLCLLLDAHLQTKRTFPAALPECPITKMDIVFLIDGSGSINPSDFQKMKDFVRAVISQFEDTNTLFALMQYSNYMKIHFTFTQFLSSPHPQSLVDSISQLRGLTYTATGIRKVVRELFHSENGARQRAKKILLVITDGKKFQDPLEYNDVTPEADRAGIVRYAIGVGNAFLGDSARQELNVIASAPSRDHVFKVDNFAALSSIQNELKEKIFAIEGTQSRTSSSFCHEMSQEGFSSVLAMDGPVLGAVGSFSWSGGAFLYPTSKSPTFINMSRENVDMRDSYLGYSTQLALWKGVQSLVLGAPRHQHTGKVVLFTQASGQWRPKAEVAGTQIGSYFGASLCSVDVDRDGNTDLVLIGAPHYYEQMRGGQVSVCPLPQGRAKWQCVAILRGVQGHPWARFGAALTVLGDVNGDKLTDVAIGAPGEQENRGAVYLFHGTSEQGINPSHSQRIVGSQISPSLQYLGQSLSGGRDLTQDGLVDLAVGAWGNALLLRSRPVLKVAVDMRFSPPEVAKAAYQCWGKEPATLGAGEATVCLTVSKSSLDQLGDVQSSVSYDLALDPGRLVSRAVFYATKERTLTRNKTLGLGEHCEKVPLLLPECVEDMVSPIVLRLNFSLVGELSPSSQNLRPVLALGSQDVFTASLPFEKNCGQNRLCEGDLRVSLSFSGLQTLVVGNSLELNVTATLWNEGEDSYGTVITFHYPAGLSYRRVLEIQQPHQRPLRLACEAVPTENEGLRSSRCNINHPIFRGGIKTTFIVTLDVSYKASLGDRLLLRANVSSENNKPTSSKTTFQLEIPVKYAIYMVISSQEESTKYLNFSASDKNSRKGAEHHYRVNNLGQRDLAVSINFWVPVLLNGMAVWDVNTVALSQSHPCVSKREPPRHSDFLTQIPKSLVLDCSVADCLRFRCDIPSFGVQEELHFVLKGNLSFDWVRQTLQKKVQVVSVAEIHFDTSTYSQFPEQEAFPRAQVEMVLEEYEIYDPVPLIAGSSVGGLLLLAIITAVLYKLGFFKRQYKEMLNDQIGDTATSNEGNCTSEAPSWPLPQ